MTFHVQPYPLFAHKGTDGPHLVLGWYHSGDDMSVTPTALLEDNQRINDDVVPEDGRCWSFTHDAEEADLSVTAAFAYEGEQRRLAREASE